VPKVKRELRTREMVCRLTGRRVTYKSKGQRPREFASAEARKLNSALDSIITQLDAVSRATPFTRAARVEFRSRLQAIMNMKPLTLSAKRYPSAVIDAGSEVQR